MATCATVKQQIRIEDVIGRVVPLKRRGSWYVGQCPFHDDRHPSLVVWPRTQTWKCMTCSPVRDDVIGFVARWRGCSTADALRVLRADLPPVPARSAAGEPETPLASLADRDRTYRALLSAWGLSDAHRRALMARGLSARAIRRAGLASAVPGIAPVVPTASGIPGFWRAGSGWRIAGPAGLAIPVRDADGRIQALHIRADEATPGGKYRWLSTPSRPGGAPSGAPVHVARGVDAVVWVTEGPLKAIVAQERLQHTVIGVPGVGAWHAVPDVIARLRPHRVILAFDQDADAATAAVVAQHVSRLAQTLTAAGWVVIRAHWTGPKGLDDALVAGAAIAFGPP